MSTPNNIKAILSKQDNTTSEIPNFARPFPRTIFYNGTKYRYVCFSRGMAMYDEVTWRDNICQ